MRVTHRAVINVLTAVGRIVGAREGDTMLSVSSISFDISALELLLPLTTGGRVVVAESDAVRDGARLCDSLVRSGATLMQATPSTWKLMLAAGWSGRSGLKVLCGGEPLTPELAGQLLERAEAVWNLYGPTETTIYSSAQRVISAKQGCLIGRPLANTRVYVRDNRGRPVPVGLPGELFIGGDGVAEGYHERPELTAERFLDDPARPGERIYRTGDRVRWHPAGSLEFLGRCDNQVKLRGFRIELGEIESVLDEHPAVSQSVAIVHEARTGDGRIVAYWTPRAAAHPPARELAEHLRARLPGYMVPATLHRLAAFPLTTSGKVDRRSIPAPEQLNGQVTGLVESPRNELETKLVAIWSNVLEREDIGIHDNFFYIGGHSLLAIRLLWLIEHELLRAISIATLFQHPTVAELADRLNRSGLAGTRPVVEHLNAGTAGPAVVMLPSLLGDCSAGRELCEFMPPHLPVYGIMLAGDQPYWDGCETLAHIARGFMDALVDAVPNGPWILVGYSFGGRVAFELARQMQARGREVQLIVILDTGIAPPRRDLAARLTRDIPSILANIPRKLIDDILRTPKTLTRRIRVKLRAWDWPLRFFKRSQGAAVPSLGEGVLDTRNLPELYKQRLEISVRAFRGYRPGTYRGRLAVLKCKVRPIIHVAEPDLGWHCWVDGVVEVKIISGHHGNMLKKPQIQVVAGTIAELVRSS